jgi:hypothetical protein
VTPTSQRTANSSRSVTKTPTFANVGGKRRSPRKGRRQRAATPHPAASPSSEIESATTSPQTTPEKPSKNRRKSRYLKKSNSNGSSTSLPDSETAISFESPLALGLKTSAVTTEESQPEDALPVSVEKPKSPAEALTMEIDYPSFQTTAILEFEPDFPQQPSPIVEPAEGKPKRTLIKSKRFMRRPRRTRMPRPPKPKTRVEEGTRPALAILFEKYGAEFSNEKRPYLQYSALEAAAIQKFADIKRDLVREEFLEAFKLDIEREWPGKEVMMSPIDQYFARNDGEIKTFEYDPRKEATVEFIRLSLEAGWIKDLPVWDVTNWNESLKAFEKVWKEKKAREERGKFKEACFYEFDQVF